MAAVIGQILVSPRAETAALICWILESADGSVFGVLC